MLELAITGLAPSILRNLLRVFDRSGVQFTGFLLS
jgi:hypothetical protein